MSIEVSEVLYQLIAVRQRIKIGNNQVAEACKGIVYVFYIHVVVRQVNDMAFGFVFACAVNARNSLDGIDIPDFLIEKEGVKARVVKSRLQFIHHDDKAVSGMLKVLDNIFFAYIVIEASGTLIVLIIAVNNAYWRVAVGFVLSCCQLLLHQFAYVTAVFYGYGYG